MGTHTKRTNHPTATLLCEMQDTVRAFSGRRDLLPRTQEGEPEMTWRGERRWDGAYKLRNHWDYADSSMAANHLESDER